jgi:hypothetical protein
MGAYSFFGQPREEIEAGMEAEQDRYEREIRERCAKLAEAMIHQPPYKEQPWARLALAIAARAIRRGRHLTSKEQLNNLANAFAEEGDADIAARIRAAAAE